MSPARRFRRLRTRPLFGFEVPVAETRWSRLLGMALLDRDRAGAGLLIPRCRGVHTFGMRFPLDVFFLDARGEVVSACRGVPPRRVVGCREAADALELPAD